MPRKILLSTYEQNVNNMVEMLVIMLESIYWQDMSHTYTCIINKTSKKKEKKQDSYTLFM